MGARNEEISRPDQWLGSQTGAPIGRERCKSDEKIMELNQYVNLQIVADYEI